MFSSPIRCSILLLFWHTGLSAAVCPPPEWIAKAHFVTAIQNPHDQSQWNFQTEWQALEGAMWRVEYGSFFPGAKDTAQAMVAGQAAFAKSPPSIPYPEPVEIPGHYLCEYTGTGEQYWITAQQKF